jgi:enediyne polyketide synthase
MRPYGIESLDFIEGHGTGTTVGDRTELEAIARVLGRNVPFHAANCGRAASPRFKSILGHTKAASGIGGLIKAA